MELFDKLIYVKEGFFFKNVLKNIVTLLLKLNKIC